MINELDLLWVPNFIALGIYFLFETKFSWNEGIDLLLMSNVCLVFATRYHSLLLVPTLVWTMLLVQLVLMIVFYSMWKLMDILSRYYSEVFLNHHIVAFFEAGILKDVRSFT